MAGLAPPVKKLSVNPSGKDIPVRKPMILAFLAALLTIGIVTTASPWGLAVPSLTVPAGREEVEPVRQGDPLVEELKIPSPRREGKGETVGLRVMSYNIHHGTGISGELDLEKVAAVIREAGADIIGLQEVDRNFSHRSAYQDQAKLLAASVGMEYVYGESITVRHLLPGMGTGYYGNMILSRYPIIESDILRLPTSWGSEPRTALRALIATPYGQVEVWSTHLGLSHIDRQKQVETLLEAVERSRVPSIVLGDFNALPGSPEVETMARRLQDAAQTVGDSRGTFFIGSSQELPRIDYIWLDNALRLVNYSVIDSTASDHLAVKADIVVLSKGRQSETGNTRGESSR